MERPPTPEQAERPLSAESVLDATTIFGSYSIVLPHPCDFSEAEKGSTHSVRQVARLERIKDHQFGRKEIEAARVHTRSGVDLAQFVLEAHQHPDYTAEALAARGLIAS